MVSNYSVTLYQEKISNQGENTDIQIGNHLLKCQSEGTCPLFSEIYFRGLQQRAQNGIEELLPIPGISLFNVGYLAVFKCNMLDKMAGAEVQGPVSDSDRNSLLFIYP